MSAETILGLTVFLIAEVNLILDYLKYKELSK